MSSSSWLITEICHILAAISPSVHQITLRYILLLLPLCVGGYCVDGLTERLPIRAWYTTKLGTCIDHIVAKAGWNFTANASKYDTPFMQQRNPASKTYNLKSSSPGHYSVEAAERFYFVDPQSGIPMEFYYADQPEVHTAELWGQLSVTHRSFVGARDLRRCVDPLSPSSSLFTLTFQDALRLRMVVLSSPRRQHRTMLASLYRTFKLIYHLPVALLRDSLRVRISVWRILAGTHYVHGQTGARSLAKSNPNEAIMNADNHETPYFDSVDELQQHGINVQDILKLKAAAINTVSGVNMTTRRQLLKIKGMSEAKVEKIKEAAHKILGSSFATGLEIQEKRKRVLAISTGSKNVDTILGGGIMSQSITEVYGEFRTGKTQLAHTMSVVAQLPPDMGGASGKARTFRPDRIRSIAERFGVNGDMALENILYARAFNSEHQMELINECSMRFAEDKDFRLLIVDSIMALFRTDYSGRGELSERQQKVTRRVLLSVMYLSTCYDMQLAQMLSKLSKLSEEFNIAILMTNQVQSDPGATMTFVAGGALKPIGGHILSHASATRMFLRKGRAEERVAKLVDSPDRPESEASYKLDEGGWADV
ncbi:hypothetical protein NM688_g863 [Phlebia brevispora]|uniref:Uncharacterized protein n=1 Tax=Phlebia brevispora TaxID=194682 RepID=A0ACC1TD55_9APHY|nr:hypothetical protein NM688_g863 [Phlebia brevispora]